MHIDGFCGRRLTFTFTLSRELARIRKPPFCLKKLFKRYTLPTVEKQICTYCYILCIIVLLNTLNDVINIYLNMYFYKIGRKDSTS